MEIIKEQWTGGKEERMTIFKEIVDGFIEKVSFNTFREMYRLLEIIRLGYNQIE